ncbi:4-amino-4-deoxy-L-arabinose transferase-like glycosyltransferase [Kribbella amoyensis]|uniref:4-amino-4-deoxy-L-arabinose transferase-like glycosyltransferase n=1 Tax=Kribbella amoyensis TaxID=996641 RepID=A0A561BQC3_9ACTN|nr:hypothetical protein [Kribbella amoyensis]TWD81089.1 4-amino-4-deoxy-L-arabinose transferase-like glycosyltransferase [Kribbella amoyensis]
MSQTAEMSSAAKTAPPDKSTDGRFGRWFSTGFSALVLLAATAFFLGTAVQADLPASAAVMALLGLVVTQLFPGVLLWRAVRPNRGWWIEDVMMGLAIGFMLAIGAQIVAGLTQQKWLSAALPLALAVLLLAVPRSRARIRRVRTTAVPLWWMPAVAATALYGVQDLHQYYHREPLTWTSGFRAPYIDAYLHLALSGQLQHRGPTSFPWVENAPMAYHWFSHAWIAQVATVSGTGLDEVLFRFMPALMPLAIVLVVAIAAVRITGKPWTGPVAALLCIAGSELNLFGMSTLGYPMSPLSPSLAPSVPLLIAIVILLVFRWRNQMGRLGLLLIPLLALAASGTKGSTMPLVVAGVGMAFVAMALFDRSRLKGLILDGVLCAGALILALVVVFQGSDSGLHVQFHDAAMATPAITRVGELTTTTMAFSSIVAVLGILARGTGLLWRLTTSEGRRDPVTWLLLGAGFAGAAAVAVFAHPGSSQYYFARTAGPLLAIGSAVGLVTMVDKLQSRWWRATLIGLVLGPFLLLLPIWTIGVIVPNHGGLIHATKMIVVGLAVLLVAGAIAWFVTPRQRFTAFFAAMTVAVLAAGVTSVTRTQIEALPVPPLKPVKATAYLAVGKDQIEAARWIRDHSDVNDVVMTNRHCTTPIAPKKCDSRRFVVGAFSERQMLVEAWTPTVEANRRGPNGRDSITVDYWKPEILELNDSFVAQPDAAKAQQLRDLGVRWIMVDFTRPHAKTLEPFAKERFRNGYAAVYEFPEAG